MRRHDADTLARLLDGAAAPQGAPADVRHLAALARSIETRATAPRPEFRTDLRAMLLAEAAAQRPPAWRARVRAAAEDVLAGIRTTGRATAAAGLAAMVLLVAGLGTATYLSVPGDFLHTIKVGVEDQRVDLATSPGERGTLLLRSASRRVDEAERAAADRPGSAGLALEAADVRARDGAEALLTAALQQGDPATSATLERFTREHRPRVQRLAATLGGDPGQAARDLLTTFERIDVRLGGLLDGCCPLLTGSVVRGLADFAVIPPADQPFLTCPCAPADAATEEAGSARPSSTVLPRAPDAERGIADEPRAAVTAAPGGPDGGSEAPDGARDRPGSGLVGDAPGGVTGVVDGATDTGDAVSGAVEEAVDGAVDAVSGAGGGAAGAAGEVTGAAGEAAGSTGDSVGVVANEAAETLEDTGDAVERTLDAVVPTTPPPVDPLDGDGGTGDGLLP